MSLAESGEIRTVAAMISPRDAARSTAPFLALLTADHRVGIYSLSKELRHENWILKHSVLTDSLPKLNYLPRSEIVKSQDIRYLRTTAVVWTEVFHLQHSLRGQSFLVLGNEAGDITFSMITETSFLAIKTVSCSNHAILAMKASDFDHDGKACLAVADLSGNIFAVHWQVLFDISSDQFDISAAFSITKLDTETNPSRIGCMALLYSQGSATVAVTSSGKIDLYHSSKIEPRQFTSVRHDLDWFAPISALCWLTSDREAAILLVFGAYGQSLALGFNETEIRLSLHLPTTKFLHWISEQLLHSQDGVEAHDREGMQIQYHGAAVSSCASFVAISYSIEPSNRVQYILPATSESSVTVIKLPSGNIPKDEFSVLLARLIENPFAISVDYILRSHKICKQSVLQTLRNLKTSEPENSGSTIETILNSGDFVLSNILFMKRLLNSHRVALASRELNQLEETDSITQLQNYLWTVILTDSVMKSSAMKSSDLNMLRRYADHLILNSSTSSDLLELAKNFYRGLVNSAYDLEAPVLAFLESEVCDRDAWPKHDLCPACRAPVSLSQDISQARCPNGHLWKRCSLTLEVLGDLNSRSCMTCNRKAIHNIVPRSDQNDLRNQLLTACKVCYYCLGAWSLPS